MALDLTKAAQRHYLTAKNLIRSSTNTLDIKVRATRPQASGASLFADLAAAEDAPETTHADIDCIWVDQKLLPNSNNKTLQLVGYYPDATAYVDVLLEDVLTDPDDPYSETYFDISHEVVYRGHKYKVITSKRHGMGNLPPYLLTVVLSGEVRNRV